MDDSPLIFRQFTQSLGKFLTEQLFIRIVSGSERRKLLGGKVFLGAVAAGTAAHEVHSSVVCEADEESPFIPHPGEVNRLTGEPNKNFLQHIAGIRLIAREVQEKGKKGLRVLVVEPFDIRAAGHVTGMTHPPEEFV